MRVVKLLRVYSLTLASRHVFFFYPNIGVSRLLLIRKS